jgi:nitric oxide reductase subunit B
MRDGSDRRGLIVSRGWIQASIVVMLFGFSVMGMLAYGANEEAPPLPQRIVDLNGAALFTAADIVAGQEIFLRNGLMEYGSIFGHGAYLGPDYTADALRRATRTSSCWMPLPSGSSRLIRSSRPPRSLAT